MFGQPSRVTSIICIWVEILKELSMLKSNSPKSLKMAYSIPWLRLPTDCTHGGQRSSSKGRLAALGLVCSRRPGLPWSCTHLLPFSISTWVGV